MSLNPKLSILEYGLNLSQAFYEQKFFSVGMKFSKSTFATSFLRDKFWLRKFQAKRKKLFFIKWLGKVRNTF